MNEEITHALCYECWLISPIDMWEVTESDDEELLAQFEDACVYRCATCGHDHTDMGGASVAIGTVAELGAIRSNEMPADEDRPALGYCGLCTPTLRLRIEHLAYHMRRVHNRDLFEGAETWPDGEPVVIDHSLTPQDFTG